MDTAAVGAVDVVAPDEVQGDIAGRQRLHRLDQFEHALVGEPVGDAQHGDLAAAPKIRVRRTDRQVAAGLDDVDR